MTTRDDLDRLMTAWLEGDAPGGAPNGLLDAVVEQAGRTHRRPGWLLPEWWLPGGFRRHGALPVAATLLVAVAALFAIAALLVVGSQRRLPAPFGLARPGLIAFDSDGHLFVVNADGTGRRQLTSGDTVDSSPSWSLDGTRVAYWSGPRGGGPAALVVMDADGRRGVPLDYQVFEQDFGLYLPGSPIAWSPDGTRLAYSVPAGGASEILVTRTDGGGTMQVSDPRLRGTWPTWAPDGRTIAFRGGANDAEKGVYLMDADGTNVRRITTVPVIYDGDFVPAWSPDGRWILFRAQRGSSEPVWRVGADGSGEMVVADAPGSYAVQPAWSPDGRRIAFIRAPAYSYAGGGTLIVADADGANQRALPFTGLDETAPIWSPDGRRVIGYRADTTHILGSFSMEDALVVQDAVGTEPPLVIPARGSAGGGAWQRLVP